jgi:hypothetical protein
MKCQEIGAPAPDPTPLGRNLMYEFPEQRLLGKPAAFALSHGAAKYLQK